VQHSPTAAALLMNSFLLNHALKSFKLKALIKDLGSHTAAYDRKSKRLKKSSSDWLNSGDALMQRVKNTIVLFARQCRSTSYLRWHSKVFSIAHFIGSISVNKNVKIRSRVS